MVSRRTRVACWIFRRDHPSRPKAMICCFLSSFKTFAMLREATYPPAAVNVLDVSSESMAAFQVILYGRFWVFTEDLRCGTNQSGSEPQDQQIRMVAGLCNQSLFSFNDFREHCNHPNL
jgi:hypothetical protein